MKKTLQTAMTAAMFAAAATAMTAGVSALPENSQVEALEMFAQNAAAPGTTTMTLYGPPPVDFTDDFGEEETTFTSTVETDPFTPYDTDPVVLYGPPSFLYEHGDLNTDRKFDARDLTLLKQELLRYQRYLKENPESNITIDEYIWDSARLDVNDDGKIDKEDIKALRRMLTGKSKEQEDAEEHAGEETTTTPTTTMTSTTTTFSGPTQTWPTTTASTVLTTMTMPLYGPPWVFTTTEPVVTTDVTEELPQPEYGPMPVEEIQ